MMLHRQILARIETLRQGKQPFCIATVIRTADATSAKAGAKAIVVATDNSPDALVLEGYIGGSCVCNAVKKASAACIESGQPQVIRVKPRAVIDNTVDSDGTPVYPSGCPSGGSVEIFLEPILSYARLIVCGQSAVAQALIPVASSAGLDALMASVCADGQLLGSTGQAADKPLLVQPRDSIVVVTQGSGDRPALLAALQSDAQYVGMVGSQRKIRFLKQRIAEQINAARLDQLHGPAGLDIGAIAPEEIAVSIVAQIIAFRRQTRELAPAAIDQLAGH